MKVYRNEYNVWSPDCWGRMEDSGWQPMNGIYLSWEIAENHRPKDRETVEYRTVEIEVIES